MTEQRMTEAHRKFLEEAAAVEARLDAEQRAKEQAEAEYRNSLDGRLEPFRENEPPDDLKVSVAGLSPARARYVRFAAWVERTRRELADAEAARERALTALGAPQVVAADLERLRDGDKTGWVAWLMSGALGKAPDLHSFRRAQIEAKLATATHEAEVARHGLGEIDGRIEFLKAAIDALENRREGFIRAVLKEAAVPLVQEYDALLEQVEIVAARLGGVFGRIHPIDVPMPSFGASRTRLSVEMAEINKQSRIWNAKADKLRADPLAEIAD